jgi:hypothetical protein
MSIHFISETSLREFLAVLAREAEVHGTVEQEERLNVSELDAENVKQVTLRTVRSYASPKALLFPVCERVAAYTASGGVQSEVEQPARVVLGLRQCDLGAIHVLDKIFLEGDFVDPFYKARRDATLLLSNDCADAAESCFCTLIEGKPYPTEGFDVNFSPLAEGYIVETGSKKGEELVGRHRRFFAAATEGQLRERESERAAIRKKVEDQNREFRPERPLKEVFEGEVDEKAWQEIAWDCVECGACTNICPACHCFLMFDRPVELKEEFERHREWDSCVFGEYHRMAGAAGMKPNPRPEMRTRFGNRFLHKYLYFCKMFGMFACTGCG